MEHLEQLEALGNLSSAINETREILHTLDEPLTDEDLKQIEDLLDAMIVALESDCLEMFVDLFTQLHDTVVMYDNGIFAQFVAYSLQFKIPNSTGANFLKIKNSTSRALNLSSLYLSTNLSTKRKTVSLKTTNKSKSPPPCQQPKATPKNHKC